PSLSRLPAPTRLPTPPLHDALPIFLTPPRVTVDSLKGRPAVVNFWASWCGPCRKEAPELSALSRDLHGRATLVGVNWNDAASGADRKSTRLNSSHQIISYAVFCLKK